MNNTAENNPANIQQITFVWNADFSIASGLRALKEAIDGEHSCQLCEIAYHRVTQTSEWKSYKQALKQHYHCDIREPCRNQLNVAQQDALNGDFPAVLAHLEHGEMVKLLGGRAIHDCDGSFQPFKAKLDAALAALAPAI